MLTYPEQTHIGVFIMLKCSFGKERGRGKRRHRTEDEISTSSVITAGN